MDYKDVCNVLKLSTKSYYNKYSGVTDYKLSEIITLMRHYNMSLIDLLPIIKSNGAELTKKLKEN